MHICLYLSVNYDYLYEYNTGKMVVLSAGNKL